MRKILSILMLGMVTGLAHAGGGFMPWGEVMHSFDANQDGGVTLSEAGNADKSSRFIGFQPFLKDHFADLDANKDGMVDDAEVATMMKAKQWTDKAMVNQFYKNTGFMPTNPENQ
jgi:hypothetical protein